MFRFMLQEDLTQYDLSCIKHCCIAGEPLNPEVFNKWYELTGIKLYGPVHKQKYLYRHSPRLGARANALLQYSLSIIPVLFILPIYLTYLSSKLC